MYASPQIDMGYDISDYNAIYPPVRIHQSTHPVYVHCSLVRPQIAATCGTVPDLDSIKLDFSYRQHDVSFYNAQPVYILS